MTGIIAGRGPGRAWAARIGLRYGNPARRRGLI